MTEKEKEHSKKVNIDKAKNGTKACIIFSVIGLITYIGPLMHGDFDFGIIFEIITLLFIFIARSQMSKYDENSSKRYIIIAMIPIGWLLIYDLISIISSISNVLDFTFLGYDFIVQELLIILNLIMLFSIINDLNKAGNPEENQEDADWFYERLDEEDNKKDEG